MDFHLQRPLHSPSGFAHVAASNVTQLYIKKKQITYTLKEDTLTPYTPLTEGWLCPHEHRTFPVHKNNVKSDALPNAINDSYG